MKAVQIVILAEYYICRLKVDVKPKLKSCIQYYCYFIILFKYFIEIYKLAIITIIGGTKKRNSTVMGGSNMVHICDSRHL